MNRLNLDHADYEHIVRRIGELLAGVPILGLVIGPRTRLYRARKSKDKLTRVSELGAPPASAIVNYQRCNPPNEPMFYCATHQAPACYEIHATAGDIVYVSCWHVRQEFISQVIPPDRALETHNRTLELISTFFEAKFAQPIHETFSRQYKITSAIADRLTAKEFSLSAAPGVERRKALQHGVGCILYPSVAHPHRAECLAIRPKILEQCLQFSYVEEWLVTAIGDGKVSVERIDVSSSQVNGEIIWSGKPLHWTLKEANQTVTATAEPDGWIVRNEKGEVINPG